MFSSQAVSCVIVVYLFKQFALPVSLKNEIKEDSDSDGYEEEFDKIRDPNTDLMFYANQKQNMFQRSYDGVGSYDVSKVGTL